MPDLVKFNVKLHPRTYARLQAASEAQGVTMADVVREALLLHAFVAEQAAAGNVLQVRRADGSVVEMAMPGLLGDA